MKKHLRKSEYINNKGGREVMSGECILKHVENSWFSLCIEWKIITNIAAVLQILLLSFKTEVLVHGFIDIL